jgi:hypothetical protein
MDLVLVVVVVRGGVLCGLLLLHLFSFVGMCLPFVVMNTAETDLSAWAGLLKSLRHSMPCVAIACITSVAAA